MDHSELRAADDDRKRVLAQLERHFVDGRLDSDEYDERVGKALAARTYGELDTLVRDLPTAPAQPAEPDELEERGGLLGDKDFRAHLVSYGTIMALLVAIWLVTNPGGYFWPAWPMLGWGIAVATHGLKWAGWMGRGRRQRRRRLRRRANRP